MKKGQWYLNGEETDGKKYEGLLEICRAEQ